MLLFVKVISNQKNMKKHLIGGYLAMAAALIVGVNAQASPIVVFDNVPGAGSQNNFVLGMDFIVNTPVTVTELGTFDSLPPGLNGTIDVGIFNMSGALVAPSVGITGLAGTLVNGERMVTVTPFTLTPGRYSIVAAGYGLGGPDLSGNTGFGGLTSFNNDGGALSIVAGGGRWQNGNALVLPTANLGGYGQPDPVFQAGTFSVDDGTGPAAVPDGGTTVGLLGMALVGLASLRMRLARA
jgi:hypothetical protein